MIVVGTLMAILAGCGLPGHMLLFGDVIDRFISHDLADNLTSQFNITSNISLSVLEELSMGNNGSGYFCNFTEDSSSSNILKFILSPDRDQQLQMEVGLYSIYYLGLATALFLVSFISVLFWNISAYRQTRRMRLAFFKSIMRQDIGWFDVNPSAELSTRLSDDIEKIQAGIGDKAAIFLQYFSTFIAGFLIAFIRNWKMTLVVGTMLPVLSLLAGLIAKVVATFTVREQNAYASAGAVAEEVLGSIRTVVAFGGEYKEIERYMPCIHIIL
jgi:ABC-type multidrug transport system fused ATPase/permease subunit